MFAAALVSRHLGPVDFGRFQTVIALTTMVQVVADFGLTVLGLREYSHLEGEARDRFMRVLLGLRLAALAVGLAAATVAGLILGYDEAMLLGAVLMVIGFGLSTLGGTISVPLQADLRMGVMTSIDLVRQFLTAAAQAALVVASAGLLWFWAAPIPVYVIVLVLFWAFTRGQVPLRPSFDLAAWRAMLRPTIAVALATSAGSLFLYTAMVVVDQVASDTDVGLFAAGFRVYVIVASVPPLLATIIFPLLTRAARNDRERLRYLVGRTVEGTALLGGAALIGCVVGAPVIIDVIGGAEYAGAVPVLRIQGIALALTFVIAGLGFVLLALRAHRPMLIANLVAMTVVVIGVAVLGSTHGAEGAALGAALGEITLVTGSLIAVRRTDAALQLGGARVVRLVPAVAVATACALLPIPALPAVALALVVYVGLVLLLDALPAEVRDHVPGPLRGLGARSA